MRAAGFSNDLAVDDDAHMARTRQRIDALEGIARVLEKLFFLFHPLVHLWPVKSEMILDSARRRQCVGVAPDRALCQLAAGADRPIGRRAFDRTIGSLCTRREEIGADIFLGEI